MGTTFARLQELSVEIGLMLTVAISTLVSEPATAFSFSESTTGNEGWASCNHIPGCYQQRPNVFPSESLIQTVLQDAAQKSGLPVSALRVVSSSKVVWRDGCLGIYVPDGLCTMALVENWLITVASDRQVWNYSINEGGKFQRRSQPGDSQANPVLPDVLENDRFIFRGGQSGRWFDPPMTPGYRYEMLSGSLFTQLLNFPVGIDHDETFAVLVGNVLLGQFRSDQSVDFVALLGFGVPEFTIAGIDPWVNSQDPIAFPVRLSFNTDTADFSMQPLSSSAVPEPSTVIGLLIAGASGLGVRLRQKKKG